MMGALQSILAIALTVLSGCLSGLMDGAVKISKNTFEASPPPSSFLCQLVGFPISFSWQMLNGKAPKVPFHLPHLRKILDKFWLFGLTLRFYVIFDDLGVALD
jgi:hypothetical protein